MTYALFGSHNLTATLDRNAQKLLLLFPLNQEPNPLCQRLSFFDLAFRRAAALTFAHTAAFFVHVN
jgi:hypothetical protein